MAALDRFYKSSVLRHGQGFITKSGFSHGQPDLVKQACDWEYGMWHAANSTSCFALSKLIDQGKAIYLQCAC